MVLEVGDNNLSMNVKSFKSYILYKTHEFLNLHEFYTLESNPAKRRCKCQAEEWLFSKKFPAIDEKKYSWKRMYPLKFKHF
jgi:hypothetical protein